MVGCVGKGFLIAVACNLPSHHTRNLVEYVVLTAARADWVGTIPIFGLSSLTRVPGSLLPRSEPVSYSLQCNFSLPGILGVRALAQARLYLTWKHAEDATH